MAIFSYKAKDQEGILRVGSVEAKNPQDAANLLFNHGLSVMSIEEHKNEFSLSRIFPFLNRVSNKERVLFSRQLATLINAQVPIIQALHILEAQVSSSVLKLTINEMTEDIEGGRSLSESMTKFPAIFSDLFVSLVKAGELTGTLDETLRYIADQQEKDYDLMAKVRGAMIYPIFIVSAIIVVGALMFVFVLPQMLSVLKEAGAALPLTTRILIFVTEFIQKYWAVIIIAVVGAIVGFRLYIRSVAGRLIWDSTKIKIPIVGRLLQRIYLYRFSQNLSTLIAGGIPIVKSLDAVAEIVGNSVYKGIVSQAAREVESGKSIASVFQQYPLMPAIVTQMIQIGEQTGNLDALLKKLANFYDKEVENLLGTLTTLLEPIIMLLLGAAVAVMVAGILLPIYNLASVQ